LPTIRGRCAKKNEVLKKKPAWQWQSGRRRTRHTPEYGSISRRPSEGRTGEKGTGLPKERTDNHNQGTNTPRRNQEQGTEDNVTLAEGSTGTGGGVGGSFEVTSNCGGTWLNLDEA